MPASYFDVDGTLVTTNLVHPTLFYMLNQPTPLHSFAKLGRALVKAPWMMMAETRDRRLLNELLFTSYEGVSEDRLICLADEAFEKVMKQRLYRGARDLVKTSLDKGHDVVRQALERDARFDQRVTRGRELRLRLGRRRREALLVTARACLLGDRLRLGLCGRDERLVW